MNSLAELVIRIIRGNSKKYKLFFICNVVAIAMFMSLVDLGHNDSLNKLDSIIASNIYAPMYLMGLFLCFFIPYTQQLFQIQMLKEYAILRAIGMDHRQMMKCLVIQNTIMALFSVFVGVAIGTVLEMLLICSMDHLIGIKLYFQLNVKDVEFVVVYACILFLVSIGIGLLRVGRKNIYDQMLIVRVSEEKKDNVFIRNMGIILSSASIAFLFMLYRTYSNIAIFCMLLNFIGLMLILANCRQCINRLRKRLLFWASDWNYYYQRNFKIVYATSVLFFSMMFLLMMAVVTFPNFETNAYAYHPYDIAFSMYDDMEWIPDNTYIKNAAQNHNIKLISSEEMKYFNDGSFSVFDVEEVNHILERNYECEKDEAIFVNCVVENDGYEHDSSKPFDAVHFGNTALNVNKITNDVLFGNGCGTTDGIILLNHQLYVELAKDRALCTLYAYNFSDYSKTRGIYQQLQMDILQKNYIDKDQCPYISCKQLALENAKQSSSFLLLLLAYDSVLILFSVYIIIRFKLGIEFESEQHKLNLLRSVGSDEYTVRRISKSKIYSIFMIPFGVASLVLLIYSYGTNYTYGYGLIGVCYGALVIMFVMIFTLVIAMCLEKKNYKMLIN